MSTLTQPGKISVKQWSNTESGEFIRQQSSFRNSIPSPAFPAVSGRYHLYISFACPWAHRTVITLRLKGLHDCIGVSCVNWLLAEDGWSFSQDPGSETFDSVEQVKFLKELYFKANPDYKGRFTVPVLWDRQTKTIVNNESSEIIRILNSGFQHLAKHPEVDLYPADLQSEIDSINSWIYDGLNNGVYKAGFATKQDAYETNCKLVFHTLDRIETELLADGRQYLLGSQMTEADVRLFTTVVRFDPVYHGHFRCNLKTIEHGYPRILEWLKRIYNYQYPLIAETINMEHIKKHYYCSHVGINPTQIVPLSNGPQLRQ